LNFLLFGVDSKIKACPVCLTQSGRLIAWATRQTGSKIKDKNPGFPLFYHKPDIHRHMIRYQPGFLKGIHLFEKMNNSLFGADKTFEILPPNPVHVLPGISLED